MTHKIDMRTNRYITASDSVDRLNRKPFIADEKGVINKYQNFLNQNARGGIVLPTKKMDQPISINGLLQELQECQLELKNKNEELRQVYEALEAAYEHSFKIPKRARDFSAGFSTSPAYKEPMERGILPDDRNGMAYYFDNMATYRGNEAELCMAAAFEAQEGIIVANANKVILRVNKAFTRITGYTTEEMIGRTFGLLHAGFHDVDFYKKIFGIVSTEGYWQGEIWNKHKNGELFPVLQTITGVRNPKGEISYYVGTLIDITPQKKVEINLLDMCNQLENKVNNTQEELKKNKTEMVEITAALTVLLKHSETDKSDAQAVLSKEIETTILPFLKKLKAINANRQQTNHLLEILEINLNRLIKSYGCPNKLLSAYQKLTPIETQVAIMVRQNFPTKIIASTLNIAPGTVAIHRKHIRKKLGLANKATNLHSYLLLLTE